MTITFWGVRGSIPSPSPLTMRFGGNTSCVSIELGTDNTLVLDAGSGIRNLGKYLMDREGDILILVSHMHWDHIQGFPFFEPIYQEGRRIFVFPNMQDNSSACSLIEQMDGAHFPVTPDKLPSQWQYVLKDEEEVLQDHGFAISRLKVNHPGGCTGFRIENAGRSVVYIPDNELDPPVENKYQKFSTIANFCQDADVLIHDAMYTSEDFPEKRGWGHSTVSQACDLAIAAKVKHLILFHHDPDRSDEEVDAIEKEAQARLSSHGIVCQAAFEGLQVEMSRTQNIIFKVVPSMLFSRSV